MTTGELIRKYRERAGMTVAVAAAKAEVGQRSWYEYEKDEASPTVRMLERIALALDTDARSLVPAEVVATI